MISIDNPDDMTPDEILNEVAALLARGFWRHHQRCSFADSHDVDIVPESSLLTEKELDFPGHRSPNGDAG